MATYKDIRYNTPVGTNKAFQLIKSIDSTNSDNTISFVNASNGVVFDSTYKAYCIKITNANPEHDQQDIQFNFTADGSNYNVTKTTSVFRPYHFESATGGADYAVQYRTDDDLAQATGFQQWSDRTGGGSDESASGYVLVFEPSSTTFVKHFYAIANSLFHDNATTTYHIQGYCNTTSAVTGIQFAAGDGNGLTANFKLYGVN
jgi:hypothetical protein|tara:strand:- start:334 stop:942 length:609 start_codon:yes stop_codon:yes gene_type:complete